MRAIFYQQFGSYEQLQLTERPIPQPREGEVLLRMRLAGVSPLDDTIRAGHLSVRQPTFPFYPGTSGVGTIVSSTLSAFPVGTRVSISVAGGYGLVQDGTWQEYMVAQAQHLTIIPDSVSDEDAAAVTTGAGYITPYLALKELAHFTPGQRVFAPGISGSIGLGTMQIAQALGASQVISTASTTAKAEQGRAMGYEIIDLSQETLRDGVARATNGAGVHAVIDGVAGPLTGQALASLAQGGTLVNVGYSGGTETTINVTDMIWKTAHMQGFMFSFFSLETLQAAERAIFTLLAEGRLKPLVGRTFPLEDAAEAQRHLIEGRSFGRVHLSL